MDWAALYRNTGWELLKSLPQLLWTFRYLLLMMALFQAAKFAFHRYEQRRLAASEIDEIDRMDGRTFEKYLEVLFKKLGYRVELTKYVGDYGADLVTRKDGVKTVIQAKRYKKSVGVKAIQEAVAAKGYYGCEAAMVVTNSTYTKQALELARANYVTLRDREWLIAALLSVREVTGAEREVTGAEAVPPVAPALVSTPPTPEAPTGPAETLAAIDRCATCGVEVSEKVRAYCAERPERFGSQVYCFDHQRSQRRSPATVSAAGD